jgi:hypothetical protein
VPTLLRFDSADGASALASAEEHTMPLEWVGITDIRVKLFRVDEPRTATDGGPV